MSDCGEVIAMARRSQGLTQEQLAKAVGVSQVAIHRYETGMREPDEDVLARVAEALGLTPRFLREAGRTHGAMAVDAHMRRAATAKPTVWRRLEAKLNLYRLHTRYILEDVSLHADQVVPRYDPLDVAPADAARLTRMQWRVPIGPINSLVRWVEAAGCVVIEEDFGTPRVDGLSQWVDDRPIILLNSRAPSDRKRLTVAHELGHLCLHAMDVSPDMEQEANEFAAEFLMPMEVIRPQLRNLTLGKLRDLKRLWAVSMQALIERAHAAKMITGVQRRTLYKQLSARGWRTREPITDELSEEHPRLITDIGNMLVAKGFSADEIADLAGFADAQQDRPFLPARRTLRVL